MVRQVLRTTVFPLVFGTSLCVTWWGLQQGHSAVPLVFGITTIAALVVTVMERLLPYEAAWSQSHGDMPTDLFYAEQELGDQWEVLNSGMSGYRSLNIFRMIRTLMPPFEADIYVVNCMVFDSPSEDGVLHQEFQGTWQHRLREATWNSRLKFVL